MKKIILLLCTLHFALCTFAATDTDRDGVSDDRDICPRVYARSESGCPRLTAIETMTTPNLCISQKMQEGFIWAYFTPLCSGGQSCPFVSQVAGIQSCDPLIPIILDANRNPLVRGPVFIVDFR